MVCVLINVKIILVISFNYIEYSILFIVYVKELNLCMECSIECSFNSCLYINGEQYCTKCK